MKILKTKKLKGKLKTEALELRKNMDENPHYNLFVGDDRYKTEFNLNFKKNASKIQYKKAIFRRFKSSFRLLASLKLLLFIFSCITNGFRFSTLCYIFITI